jgi:predicted ferric reductase
MAKKRELSFFGLIILFGLTTSLVAYTVDSNNTWNLAVRLLALNGFIALCIASIMTAFLKDIIIFFKKPFTRIHHYFAAAGLALITLHPIILAIQLLNPSVFLPNLNSLYSFFAGGGRQALIIIFIAVAAVLLRKKMVTYWRRFHALMYVSLFFGIVHANLLGTDLENFAILIVFNGIFIGVIVAFIFKRWQFYSMKKQSEARQKSTNNVVDPPPS